MKDMEEVESTFGGSVISKGKPIETIDMVSPLPASSTCVFKKSFFFLIQ